MADDPKQPTLFPRENPGPYGVARRETEATGPAPLIGVVHSAATRAEAVAEARWLGDPSTGSGWRRLLWRMADLVEGDTTAPA